MGKNKKYYWLKLKENFFEEKQIKYLRSLPDVAKNLKDFGALYGIVQKSDVSKPNKSGYYSIVFGQNNDREKANYSITAGLDNKSNEVHNFTQLFGEGLISDNSSETLLGAYNKPVVNGALIIKIEVQIRIYQG